MAIVTRKLKGRTVYRIYVRDANGEWFPTETRNTKQEAKEREAELIGLRAKGGKAGRADARQLTLDQYWDQWAAECRQKVKAGWRRTQDQMYRDYIKPVLGTKKVVDIEKPDVLRVLAEADKKGKGAQTRIHIFNLIHKMFADAIETYEYLNANPALSKYRPATPVVERPYYKPEQAWKFLEAVSEDEMGICFWIMILCGPRSGEMQAVQIGDIHLDEAEPYILFQRQWVRSESKIGPLKNGKPVRVPIAAPLVEYLRPRMPKDAAPTDYLLKGRFPGRPISHNKIMKKLRELSKKCGLHTLTPHELRHTCTELWKASGATTKDLQNLLNHGSERSTKRYEHKSDERLNRIAKTVGNPSAGRKLSIVHGQG